MDTTFETDKLGDLLGKHRVVVKLGHWAGHIRLYVPRAIGEGAEQYVSRLNHIESAVENVFPHDVLGMDTMRLTGHIWLDLGQNAYEFFCTKVTVNELVDAG